MASETRSGVIGFDDDNKGNWRAGFPEQLMDKYHSSQLVNRISVRSSMNPQHCSSKHLLDEVSSTFR